MSAPLHVRLNAAGSRIAFLAVRHAAALPAEVVDDFVRNAMAVFEATPDIARLEEHGWAASFRQRRAQRRSATLLRRLWQAVRRPLTDA